MTEDTIFDVASLTKPVATATSIMLLVEDGKLSLSDTVAAFLPDFASHEKGAVTLLQLLTHYSGLRPDLDLDEPWSGYETAVSKACAEKLVALPGERFIYSDINYLVLGEVVRLVGGRQISDFVRERVFVPLNMVDTGFLPSPEMMSRIAPSERRNDRIIRGEVHDPTAFRMGGVAGHAGLFSTADDLAIYAQALLNGGIHSAVRILSPLSVVKMSTPQSPPEAAAWRGVGFDIRSPFSHNRGDLLPVGSFGHTGFTGTSLWIDPFTETFVVILTNRLHPDGKGNATPLRRRVASVVAASLVEIPSWRELYERSR
jgi:CubicO group peptidase (beta-lactamase class C family)